MKIFAFLRMVVLVLAGLAAADLRVPAQILSYSLSTSASSVLVSNSVVYSIDITNFSNVPLVNLVVTDSLPSSVQITGVSPDVAVYTNYGSSVVFYFNGFSGVQIAEMTVTAEPTAVGLITNTLTISSASLFTNISTNIVVDVTNLVIDADLGVTMSGPSQPVITNDWMTYGITVSNAGPSAAANVILTNYIPPVGFILERIFPTNLVGKVDTTNSIVYFSLGTIPDGGSTNIQLTLQAPVAGTLTFTSSVGSASITDPNLTNNLATTNITVLDPLPDLLVAVTNSAQIPNPQNGLTEQSILISNADPVIDLPVPAARLVVTGLPKQLYNAVGTNDGNPFVTLAAPLSPGQSVNLLLQYNPRGSFPFTNGQLQAYGVPFPNLTPPVATSTSTNLNISGIFKLANGNVLIEFPAKTNQTYTVVYSDNASFSNAMIAPPAIVAPANIVQWIDYGPPATASAPTNSNSRFYRVLKNP